MTTTETNLDAARELGRAAWCRSAEPFAIKDRALDALTSRDALPLGEGIARARDAVYLAWFEGYDAAKAAGEPQTEEKPRLRLTITHTSADGTLLEGSSKGDGAWEAIKAAQDRYRIRGWRYMPSIRAVGVSHSRGRYRGGPAGGHVQGRRYRSPYRAGHGDEGGRLMAVETPNLPPPLPVCPSSGEHGQMVLRTDPDKLSAWCGTWYDCLHPGCRSSILFDSPELQAQLAEQRARLEEAR